MSLISAIGKTLIRPVKKVFRPKMVKNTCFTLFHDINPAHSIVLDKAVASKATMSPDSKIFPYFTEVNELLNETISSYDKNVRRFKTDDIFKLAPVMKEEPKIVRELLSFKPKENEYFSFKADGIIKLLPVVKKHPEMARKLIQATKINGEPRFLPDEIIELAPLMSDNPNIVEELLNIKIDISGHIIPKLKGSEIVSLVPVMKENPKIVRLLLKEKTIGRFGYITARFDTEDIIQLASVMKENPEIVRLLLKEKTISRFGYITARFDTKDIIHLASVIKKEPKFKKIIKAKIRESGKILPRYNMRALNYLSKSFQEFSMVKDKKVISEIRKLINEGKFKDADTLIDAMNNIEGNYSSIYETYFRSAEKSLLFSKYLKSNSMSLEKLSRGEITEELAKYLERKKLSTNILTKDFELDCKYQRMAEFLKKNPDNEISNYLYENYYLKDLEYIGIKPKVIEKCKNINKKYNVKIMPSTDSFGPIKAIESFEKELEKWVSFSEGKAKLPPVVDFSTANSRWYKTSACGKNACAAYSTSGYNGAIAFNRFRKNVVELHMRHEMTHTNDLARVGHKIPEEYNIDEIMPHYIEEIKIDEAGKGKYYQELKNAGLSDSHILYGYNSPKEFIAVASEGDMSKYTPEFKQVLIDFGMPEWVLNIH